LNLSFSVLTLVTFLYFQLFIDKIVEDFKA